MADIIVKNTEGTEIATISADSIDSTFDVAMIGESVEDYMIEINNNFVKLLENFAGAETPPKASTTEGVVEGQIWYDNVNERVNYRTSSEWTSNADTLSGKSLDGVREYTLSGLDTTGKLSKTGGIITGDINVNGAVQIQKSVIPDVSDRVSLGGENNRFRNVYLKEDGIRLGEESKDLTFNPHNFVYAVSSDHDDVSAFPKGAIILHQETGEAIIKKSTGDFSNYTYVDDWKNVINISNGSMTTTNLAKYVETKDVDVYRSDGNKIYFSGGSGSHLVYSFPLDVDSKEVSFSIHFYGYSMEGSGFYWYVEDADGKLIKIECRGSAGAHNSWKAPENCDNTNYNSTVSETIKKTYIVTVPNGAKKLKMVFFMNDNSSNDRAYIHSLGIKYNIPRKKDTSSSAKKLTFRSLADDKQNSAVIGGNKFNFMGDIGLIAGGWTNSQTWNSSSIEKITISTPGNSTSFGNLSYGRSHMGAGMSSSARGVFQGGWMGYHTPNNGKMDYVTFATTGNATYFGTIGYENYFASCVSDGTRGIIGPGYNGKSTGPQGHHYTASYITIETPGNGSKFGTISSGFHGHSVSSGTRGVFGGYTRSGWNSQLEYITIQTPSNSIYFGKTTYLRGWGAATATDAIRGVMMGGWSKAGWNNMEYITIATLGNSTQFGKLGGNAHYGAGVSNGIRGVLTNRWWNTIAEYITISTPSNSINFGNMIQNRSHKPSSASGD